MSTQKVLIIVENAPVPFDTRVWKEARCLHQSGYDVTVVCPRGQGYNQGYEVLDGIRIYRHPMIGEASSPLGFVREYGSALFWEFWYTWWIYLRHGFHVIQGCNPPGDIFLIALRFKLFGIKFIFDHHDANPELYLSKMGYLPDSGGYYMLWFRTTDNRFVRDWCHRDRLLDKAVEEFATTSGRPPVEPECEFVQVIVELFATHRSLVSAEEPALQQRRHTMNSWHQL